jgi:hypothetical protein
MHDRGSTGGDRIRRHIRSNLVGYLALAVALSMAPVYANHLNVKTSDIRNGAVTARKIGKGAVTRPKIKNGAVGRAKIADGAVTSSKLGIIVVREAVGAAPAGDVGQVIASCEAGETLLSGGGGFTSPGPFDNPKPFIIRSQRSGDAGWLVRGDNPAGFSRELRAEAHCLAP